MRYVIGNWKMNPPTEAQALRLFTATQKEMPRRLKNVRVAICPPYTFLSALRSKRGRVDLGAQDAFWQQQGSFTGEISPSMLRNLGVKFVNLGHNERRFFVGETDQMVADKARACLKQNLRPIICVGGGPKAQNKKGLALKRVITNQLSRIRQLKTIDKKKLLIAFEPIAAIGSGKTAKPALIEDMLNHVKKIIPEAKGIYGGSVNKKNAANLLKIKPVNGFLVGGASLRPREFAKIVEIASITD